MTPVVRPRFHQTIAPSGFAAIDTGDILLDFPLCSDGLRCKDILVYPEKDQSADQVSNNCSNDLTHRCKNDPNTGKDGSACLPAKKVKPVSFEINRHIR